MASVMHRGDTYWVKFRDPRNGSQQRCSLGTRNREMADLMLRKLEAGLIFADPRFEHITLPEELTSFLPATQSPVPPTIQLQPAPSLQNPSSQNNATVSEAVTSYLNWSVSQNAKRHASNKRSILRHFFGSDVVPYGEHDQRKKPIKPLFSGDKMEDISAAAVQNFIDNAPIKRETQRHYREVFHQFFEHALKNNLFHATNIWAPNPMSVLPSYHTRNRHIVFLTREQIDEQLRILEPYPSLKIGVATMIYEGLRRAEALWLRKQDIRLEGNFLSVVNKTDSERDLESSLKTGQRSVMLNPRWIEIVTPYLSTLKTDWLVPSPTGKQWDGDNFGAELRKVNKQHGLKWTCLHYRHTFATDRLAENWSVFQLSKQMGNSVSTLVKHYAGWVSPEQAFGTGQQPSSTT